MKIICPLCRQLTTWKENPWRPFCSERCKLIDLGKWASEGYIIEVEKKEERKEETGSEEGASTNDKSTK